MNHQTFSAQPPPTRIDFCKLDRLLLLELYRHMMRLRRVEEALIREYRVGEGIRCPVHFAIGQEAVPAALSPLLKLEDYLFCHHRSHGYFLSKRAPLNQLIAELFGRATGANGGLAGSQEISCPSVNFHSGAVLTGAASIAVGSALAFQLKGSSQVAVAGFGEAASEEGIFWEAINYAGVKKLPLVYLCENNIYSMYSHQLSRQASDNLHERVKTFGVQTHALYGNDVVAAYLAIKEAVERARRGEGAFFLEFYTYRWSAHVGPESDDHVGYRDSKELDFWKERCPIQLMKRNLENAKLLDVETERKMISEIDQEISEAIQFARSSAYPTEFLSKNSAPSNPLAEKLLPLSEFEKFDAYQADAVLGPY